jgi:rubrerythrin
MAREPKLTEEVIVLLAEGKTTEEIIAETGCSASTISIARKRLAKKIDDDEREQEEWQIDETISSFIKKVKIKPDEALLTDNKVEEPETKETEYECGVCGHIWTANSKEHQSECPECGEEFE